MCRYISLLWLVSLSLGNGSCVGILMSRNRRKLIRVNMHLRTTLYEHCVSVAHVKNMVSSNYFGNRRSKKPSEKAKKKYYNNNNNNDHNDILYNHAKLVNGIENRINKAIVRPTAILIQHRLSFFWACAKTTYLHACVPLSAKSQFIIIVL